MCTVAGLAGSACAWTAPQYEMSLYAGTFLSCADTFALRTMETEEEKQDLVVSVFESVDNMRIAFNGSEQGNGQLVPVEVVEWVRVSS